MVDMIELEEVYLRYDESLQMFIFHHPLVVKIMYWAEHDREWTKQYIERKQDEINKAWDAGEWGRFVFLHERPYRPTAMIEIFNGMGMLDELAEVCAEIWIDTENPNEFKSFWKMVFKKYGAMMMTGDDAKALDALPPTFTIWRGDCPDLGLSWTTQKHTAEFFAKRFGEDHELMFREVSKEEVLIFFTGRNEAEIILKEGVL